MITATRLRGIIQNNPAIALDIIRSSLETPRKQQILDIILQSPLSVSILHVMSQLINNPLVPQTFFVSFVDKTLKALDAIKDSSHQVCAWHAVEE